MRNDIKNLLDAQRNIVETRIKEVFENDADALIDIMSNLPYPTEKGCNVTPKELIMQPLTVEQLEYIELKTAMDFMLKEYLTHKKNGVRFPCQELITAPREPKFIVERLFYFYLQELKNTII